MMRGYVFLLTAIVAGSTGANEADEKIYRVHDIDFDNTKITKSCLLASFNATLDLNLAIDGKPWQRTVPFPDKADIDGSYCNANYQSRLRLNFDRSVITMTFARERLPASDPKKITYCDHCDYGTWNLTEVTVELALDPYTIKGTVTSQDIRENEEAKWLSNGIDIKRSFKCTEEDNLITLSLGNKKVLNATTKHELDVKWLNADIKFYSIQVQPFLVMTEEGEEEEFYDPYFCRDVTASHVLVIMLPLIYFFIFILFYRIKAGYGCPPRTSSKPKSEKLETEIEESTNIMSDEYSTIQLGLASSSIPY